MYLKAPSLGSLQKTKLDMEYFKKILVTHCEGTLSYVFVFVFSFLSNRTTLRNLAPVLLSKLFVSLKSEVF